MRWDTIVVGAGAAGACIAARLSEDPDHRVLLIEAGPDYLPAERPPGMESPNPYRILMPAAYKEAYIWPELYASRTNDQPARPYWSGKGVGGSSSINGQIAIRGVMEAFDEWEQLGCDGWSSEGVLPDFIKLEDDFQFGDRPYHGEGGPIPIYRAPQDRWGPVDRALRDAALSLGHPWCEDLNAPGAIGVAPFAINSRDQKRVSVKEGYVDPVRSRPNLTILADVVVDRVVLKGNVATGIKVRGRKGEDEYEAGEVILSAGAARSPGILVRSGIGPKATLNKLGLPVIADIPGVGENLMEHPSIRLKLDIRKDFEIGDTDFRHTNCCVKLSSGIEGGSFSDMLLVAMNHGGVVDQDGSLWATPATHVMLYDPHSRGRITVTSTDPLADPIIQMNMLSDRSDLDRLRLGARTLFALAETSAYERVCDRITCGNTNIPVDQLAECSDDQIDAWMRSDCGEGLHIAGTCRMGPADDYYTVVDPECRVVKAEKLRVVDASVMPADCRANTHLTTIMIAEHVCREMASA